MGTLTYGGTTSYDFDDRTLLHLQLAIASKLRRHESFLLTWQRDQDASGGRLSIWLDRAIPLVFEFTSNDRPRLNPQWIERLVSTSHRPSGMALTAEAVTDPLPIEG
ncbi:hypothetical protein [Kitasatospora herbaricolor]|uniref:DUF7882 family protein n=1 Tax=Kitasatospora herbaricolor TaxID=68217 RepID=UPI0036DD141D